jgi:hypothetical protein
MCKAVLRACAPLRLGVTSVEVTGSVTSLGRGYDRWLVRAESRYRVIRLSVVVGPDGNAEVTGHVWKAA